MSESGFGYCKRAPPARYTGEFDQQRRRPISGAGRLRTSERSPSPKFADLSGTQQSNRISQSPAQSRRNRSATGQFRSGVGKLPKESESGRSGFGQRFDDGGGRGAWS